MSRAGIQGLIDELDQLMNSDNPQTSDALDPQGPRLPEGQG